MGVGKVDESARRARIQAAAEALGYRFPNLRLSRRRGQPEVELGAGTAVFDGAVVNAGVVTGPTCIVNTNATVEHDCRLGTNVHIAPGATVSGGVTIGDHTFVGAGAVVIHGVRIAAGLPDRCRCGGHARPDSSRARTSGLPPGGSDERRRRPRGHSGPWRIAAGAAQEHPRDEDLLCTIPTSASSSRYAARTPRRSAPSPGGPALVSPDRRVAGTGGTVRTYHVAG